MANQCQDMFVIKLSHLICLLSVVQYSHCQRRIQGAAVNANKSYAVYMVRASPTGNAHLWLCGGAIVTEWYIVTSAACVQKLQFMYAIAGYKKFVKGNNLDNDECTKRKKKKIVFSCIPKSYSFGYDQIEEWTHIDIAVAKVESKFGFNDKSYLDHCSYIPRPIDVNYDGKYQQPGTDAIAVGWGHSQNFVFKKTETMNYNQKNIKYAPFLLVPKSVCKTAYKNYAEKMNIDKYMICAKGVGNLDDSGHIINKNIRTVVGCITEDQKLKGLRGNLCEEPPDPYFPYDEVYYQSDYEYSVARRDLSVSKEPDHDDDKTNESGNKFNSSNVGLCQNDHGGPLVTWVGKREILIGVFTTFILTNGSQCKGPYLFTSTQCNSEFLDCVINYGTQDNTRRKLCDNPQEIGFEMDQRHISWADHPSGPAENEIIKERQQIPIQQYQNKKK